MDAEHARARHDQMTAFMRSRTLERIAGLGRELATLDDSRPLVELLASIDLAEESAHSPVRELYVLLVAETAFVQMGSPDRAQHLPVEACLRNVGRYAELRLEEVMDPSVMVLACLLGTMRALLAGDREEALARADAFEEITAPFGHAVDSEYLEAFRRCIAEDRLDEAREQTRHRLLTMFARYFEEVLESLARKIATLQYSAESGV